MIVASIQWNKNVKSSSRNAQIFHLDLSIDDDDNENQSMLMSCKIKI